MTSKPIFPAAVLAALMLTASPGVAWADDYSCTPSGGPGIFSDRGYGCVEDVPPFIARHAQQDPFGRKPWFRAYYASDLPDHPPASVSGEGRWFQDGLAHSSTWTLVTDGGSEIPFKYQGLSIAYDIYGSNDDDTVRLKKYYRQYPDAKAMRLTEYGYYIRNPVCDDLECYGDVDWTRYHDWTRYYDWTGYPTKPAMKRTQGITFFAGSGTDTVHGTIGPDIIISDGTSDGVTPDGRRAVATAYGEYGCWESTAQKECEALGDRGTKTYYGKGGDDWLVGGRDDDWLYGGTGDDHLYGGPGRDRLDGGPGNDYLDGGPGRDRLHGGPGADWLRGGPGNDVLAGGEGSDFMVGDGGRDTYILPNNAGRGPDRDVILADMADDIQDQPFWQRANTRRLISIDDVTMPDIQIGRERYRFSPADASLDHIAYRVPGADIIFRVADPTPPPPPPPPLPDPDSDRRIDREDPYIPYTDPYTDEAPYIPYTDPYIDEDPYTVSGS